MFQRLAFSSCVLYRGHRFCVGIYCHAHYSGRLQSKDDSSQLQTRSPVSFVVAPQAVSSDQCIDYAHRNTSQRQTMETDHARPRLDSWSIAKRRKRFDDGCSMNQLGDTLLHSLRLPGSASQGIHTPVRSREQAHLCSMGKGRVDLVCMNIWSIDRTV